MPLTAVMDIPNNISNIRPIPEAKHNAVFVDFVENFNELHISHEEMKNIPKQLREQLAEVLKTLTPREEKVLSLRFGLEDGRSRTLEEVGKEFNVTRERIRQIEAKALRKLRHPSRSRKLKDYLD